MSGEKGALAGQKDVRQFQQKRGLTAPRFDSETIGPRNSNSGHQLPNSNLYQTDSYKSNPAVQIACLY